MIEAIARQKHELIARGYEEEGIIKLEDIDEQCVFGDEDACEQILAEFIEENKLDKLI